MSRGNDPPAARRIPLPRGWAWATWLRESPSALVPLAIAVGLVTGLGAVGFRALITAFTWIFTGYHDYSAVGRIPSTHVPWRRAQLAVGSRVTLGQLSCFHGS